MASAVFHFQYSRAAHLGDLDLIPLISVDMVANLTLCLNLPVSALIFQINNNPQTK